MQRSRSRLSRALAALTVTTLGAFLIPGTYAEAVEDPAFKVLLFTKTAAGAYRHSSMDAAIQAFNELGAANDFQVDESDDANVFNTTTLNTYDAVVMLQSSGMVWDTEAQRTAAQDYVRSGHGIVAVHNATDMNIEGSFPWWDDVVMGGAHATSYSSVVQGTAKVADKVHPSTVGLPDRWVRTEEWYNFDKNARGDVHVLVTADETTYDAGGAKMGADHPISWCRNAEGGKVWATAMGHETSSYSEPFFRQHLLGGLKWAAGAAEGDCGGTVSQRYQKVTLDGAPDQPMQLDVAPDGEVFYISRSGKVNVIHTHDDVSETHIAAQLDVYHEGEDGGVGLALDPDFATNRWIYINHSPAGTAEINRVTRFTVNADDTLDMASAQTVIEVPAYRGEYEPGHTGGYLHFGPGGNLYIGVGDDTNPFDTGYAPIDERPGREKFDAQRSSGNTNDLRGKILRIHPEAAGGYTIPSGNLFAPGTALTRPEIYAMGFRNSFRFSVDPETGWISAADYGPDAQYEDPNRGPEGTVEWNLIKAPGNYGWPYCVGDNVPFNDYNFATGASGAKFNCAAPVNNSPNNTGLTNLPAAKPAQVWYDYHASEEFPEIDGGTGAAPMGGPFYHYDAASTSERKFPKYYDKTPFFYEWSRNFVKEFRLDSAGDLLKINPFVAELGLRSPIDMKFGPDGAMYVAEWGIGYSSSNTDDGIYRIDYVAGNRTPLVKASATPDSGQAPLQVTFSSAGTADPDAGDVLTYAWDFGDGSTGTGQNPTHTYTANGTYTARLTVTDGGGKSASVSVPIIVGNTRPTVTFTTPVNGRVFDFGDTVDYQISVTDPEDGAVDCSRVAVTVALGHDSHAHDTGRYTGCSGSIPTSGSGHDATANTYLVLSADYTDDDGLKGTTTVVLQPRHKQAEYFTGQSGVRVVEQSGAQNGKRVGDISDGDWISFKPLNLGGVESVTFRVSAPSNTGGSIELRSGSPTGTLLATSPVPSTGGWDNYVDLAPVAVTDTAGTQTVYAVFRAPSADSFDLDAITFNAPGTGWPAPVSGSTYTVTSEHSGKRMDVRYESTADGAAVIQYGETGGSNQQWQLTDVGSDNFTLTAQHSNKCLDLLSTNDADVQQWTCVAGASDQKWKLQPAGLGAYRIVSVLSDKCLTIPQASTADDIQLTQATCSTTAANQKWRFDQI
ncbi:ThuA domain-containing protein [Streptomyces sp. NPDC056361]|uniref:ThuA domain-containing protein n=1 Tax=Streptomyces sp. NPDC056361 TaxID=3345795 RepID=UPI0035E2A1BE